MNKSSDTNWAHIKPEVFSLITQAVTSGEAIVNTVEKTGEHAQESSEQESLSFSEEDDEVVSMIKELLETRIRPAIQEDGGDIELRGFENGIVKLKLRGACRTCDSSTVTLKNGIESMLMHYVCFILLPCLVRTNFFVLNRSRRSRELSKSWMRKRKSPCMNSPSLKRSYVSRRALRLQLLREAKGPWTRHRRGHWSLFMLLQGFRCNGRLFQLSTFIVCVEKAFLPTGLVIHNCLSRAACTIQRYTSMIYQRSM